MNLKESIKNNIPFKSIKEIMPWWLKIGFKIVIYRLPIGDKFWKSIGFFQYDQMEVPEYAYNAFQEHFNQVSQLKHLDPGFTSLELGPGNSLFSALICRSLGGKKTYLVDVDNFAFENPQSYQEMASYLKQQDLPVYNIESSQSLSEIMDNCGGVYLTSGLDSLKEIEDHSVDFVWSHAVLEHIRRSEFLEIMQETRRVISDNGVCSHTVDLKDHLDESLNNLRFQENFWESSFVEKSGIYTNRIRYAEMLDIFKEAGFEVKNTQLKKWQNLPISRASLAKKFQDLSDDELCISGFSVVLIPV
jgi:predicted SAM-dependent methyltransferase